MGSFSHRKWLPLMRAVRVNHNKVVGCKTKTIDPKMLKCSVELWRTVHSCNSSLPVLDQITYNHFILC